MYINFKSITTQFILTGLQDKPGPECEASVAERHELAMVHFHSIMASVSLHHHPHLPPQPHGGAKCVPTRDALVSTVDVAQDLHSPPKTVNLSDSHHTC